MNPALLSSKSDEWATPAELYRQLNEEFAFVLDAAATAQNAKCFRFFDLDADGLSQPWATATGGAVWCNPPYSDLAAWIAKAAAESQKGATVVMLIPSRTDTRAWHRYIWDFAKHQPRPGVEVRFLPGRLKFGDAKNSAPFPSAVVVFRAPSQCCAWCPDDDCQGNCS